MQVNRHIEIPDQGKRATGGTGQSKASDIPLTNKPEIFYVLFQDELVGGCGYWLSDSEDVWHSLEGEKYLTELAYGSFPTTKANIAKEILDKARSVADVQSKMSELWKSSQRISGAGETYRLSEKREIEVEHVDQPDRVSPSACASVNPQRVILIL